MMLTPSGRSMRSIRQRLPAAPNGATRYLPEAVLAAVVMVVVSLLTHDDPEESREFYELLEEGELEAYDVVDKSKTVTA